MRIIGLVIALFVFGVLSQQGPPCAFTGPEAVWDFSSLSQFTQTVNGNQVTVGFCNFPSTSQCVDGNTFICQAGGAYPKGHPIAYRGGVTATIVDQNNIILHGNGYQDAKSTVYITYNPRVNTKAQITSVTNTGNSWEVYIQVGYNVFKPTGPDSIPCTFQNPVDNSIWDFSSVSQNTLSYVSNTGGHYGVGICNWQSTSACIDGNTMICYYDTRNHYPVAYRKSAYLSPIPQSSNQLVITGYGYSGQRSITYLTYDPSVSQPVITNAYPQDGLYILEVSVGNSVVQQPTSTVSSSTGHTSAISTTSGPRFNISITITISITISVADLSTINVPKLVQEFDKVLSLLAPTGISIEFVLLNVTKTASTYTMLVQVQIDISSGSEFLDATEKAIGSVASALADPGSPLAATMHDSGVSITSSPTASVSATPSTTSSSAPSSLTLSIGTFVALVFVVFA